MGKSDFVKGETYSRAQVAEQIGLPADKSGGGNWNTGYDSWQGEVFVFCTVGPAGRTGHNYPNEWEGSELVWYGKNGTDREQPLIKRMVSGRMPVHIFWRRNARRPFTYAGEGQAANVSSASPVQVRWTFA